MAQVPVKSFLDAQLKDRSSTPLNFYLAKSKLL